MIYGRTRYHVEPYTSTFLLTWDAFIQSSKNGTFLLTRDYMDYHSNRFADCSLVVRDGDAVIAVLPANRVGDDLYSHQGLTYGGFITLPAMTTPQMLDVFDVALSHLRQQGVRRLHYKTIPPIYHKLPAEEDRYALFIQNARLSRRDVLSVIPCASRAPVQSRRRRGAAKALRNGVIIGKSDDFRSYWDLLTDHLHQRFGTRPVHSREEIDLLRSRFRREIHLFTAQRNGCLLAGVVVFEAAQVAHVQYIASSAEGRDLGALDGVFVDLIENRFTEKPFFDFGISNEHDGRYLNRGLIEQKEGFGARAVVHDHYTLDLA
jgi:hypothetical protein